MPFTLTSSSYGFPWVFKPEIFFAWLCTTPYVIFAKHAPGTFGRFWPVPVLWYCGWNVGKGYYKMIYSEWALRPLITDPELRAKRPFPPPVSMDLEWPPANLPPPVED